MTYTKDTSLESRTRGKSRRGEEGMLILGAYETLLIILFSVAIIVFVTNSMDQNRPITEAHEISAIKPEITALIIIDRKEFINPDGMTITATEYNNGMTCYRSDYGSVWVSCDGGLSRSETSERTKRHTDRMKQSIKSIEKE